MLEILKYIFSSFWIWLGVTIWIATIAEGLGKLIRIRVQKQIERR